MLLHISFFLSRFGEGIYTLQELEGSGGLGCTHLADEVSHRPVAPRTPLVPHPQYQTCLAGACQAPVRSRAVHEKCISTNSITALTKRSASVPNVEVSQVQESPRLGLAPKFISVKGRPPLQRSRQSHRLESPADNAGNAMTIPF